MSWRALLLLRRVRDQAAVLVTAVLVVLVSTTLVGTFAFLFTVTADRAVTTELATAPESELALQTFSRLRSGAPGPVIEAIDEAVDEVLGDVPSDRRYWQTGRLWTLKEPGGARQAGYPASIPDVSESAELVAGAWPGRARDDEGRLQVAVPETAAEQRGWEVGTVVPTTTTQRELLADTWVVTGIYRTAGNLAAWDTDRLDGRAVEYRYPIGPQREITLFGPMVVTPDALAEENHVELIHHFAVPRLADVSAATLADVREDLDIAKPNVERTVARNEASASFRTSLDDSIDRAWRSAAITRSGVVAVGLLLVVLTVTVMLLAARLVADRRAGEMELVAARGASPAQLRTLAVLEAGLLALVTTGVAPWLARGVYAALAAAGVLGRAGTSPPPGIPLPVLLACAGVATLLAVALVVPAWHVRGSSTASAHAGLARTGADLAIVAIAGVALWQLLTYGTLTAAGGSGVDPVLVAGPALVVLGAATLALRLVTPAARLADALAARSTTLVAPLAAWQVARRPATTAGTALVVVLTVTAATFTHTFLATWTTSQRDQADLAVGADGVLTTGPRAAALPEAELVRSVVTGTDVRVDPLVDRQVSIGRASGGGFGSGSSTGARLVAVDTGAPDALRGLTGTDSTWADVVAGLGRPGQDEEQVREEPAGPLLPEDPEWLFATVTVETSPAASGTAYPSIALEDEWGVRTWLPGETLDVNGGPKEVAVRMPEGAGRLRVVGASVTISPLEGGAEAEVWAQSYQVGTSLHSLATTARGTTPTPAFLAPEERTPVPLEPLTWEGGTVFPAEAGLLQPETARVPDRSDLPAGAIVFTGVYTQQRASGAIVVAHSWPTQSAVRAVVSEALAEELGLVAGLRVVLDVAQVEVPVVIEGVVPHLPGAPRGAALLVDRDALSRAVLEQAGADTAVDGWRLTGEPDAVAEVAERIGKTTGGAATLRAGERAEAVGGPLFVALPASLTLATGSAALLVVVGLGTAAASAVRSRRLETARVQALGAPRTSVVAGLVGEHALLVLLGTVAGLGIGYGAAVLVAPLLTASQDGRRPVPEVVLQWSWGTELLLAGALALAACTVVALLTATLVRRASGALLRLGDDR